MRSTIALLTLATSAWASSGDRSLAFQSCLSQRSLRECTKPAPLPLPLRLTGWTCEDDCKYQCSHLMTDIAISKKEPIEQFYGKWAFWRFLGMQEPASVFFSLLNLWAHVQGGRKIRKRINNHHPMKSFYVAFTYININTWVWSTIFHTRDKPFTERMDYFSAGLGMVYGLYYTVVRLFHLYIKPQIILHGGSSLRNRLLVPWGVICGLLFLSHVTYLTILPRFDYGWNMKVNIVVGLGYSLLWIMYSFPSPPFQRFREKPNSYRPSYVWMPTMLSTAMICAAFLEVFDFPPWGRVIDAHSLWHLATVPIIIGWYEFLLKDSLDVAWKQRISS
ncbi:Per1-like protein [Serendipita vermifera]|nr:Per1-like protein [Serendipita vermifera]